MINTRTKARALRYSAPAAALLSGASTLLFSTQALAINCDDASIPHPVYVTGSSAVKPFLDAIAKNLAQADSPITIVYPSSLPGSCVGVRAVGAGATKVTGTATYYDDTGAAQTCDLSALNGGTGAIADIGASDVFASSCVNYDEVSGHEGIGDFFGPNQVMTFAVPHASSQKLISAEAAYLTFGFDDAGAGVPWDDKTIRYRRNENSGTQSMIAIATYPGVVNAPLKFNNHATGVANSQAMITALASPTGDADATIGILATGETDANRDTITRLAFQDYGQTCSYYPDSELTSFDKMNVRDGHYQIWGPVHLFTPVNSSGVPTSADAATVIDALTNKGKDQALLDLAISKFVVPQCAMQVTRDAEIGALSSYQPDASCGCYFDAHVPGGSAPAECTVCSDDSDCGSDRPACNYGFCEVQ